MNSIEYIRYYAASNFNLPIVLGSRFPLRDTRQALRKAKQRSIDLLNAAIDALKERIEEAENSMQASSIVKPDLSSNRQVFIVHGHDDAIKQAVARFLEQIGFTPIILGEQANQGRTIIEKFEAHTNVGFAVVLLTPDDEGRAMGKELQPRARQNVILELGYFIGKLGRSRVCALRGAGIEIPSDILGVVWTEYDQNGGWRMKLAQELQAAGYEVDRNKVIQR
jgi:predicted nucleotide-binding protein